MKRKGLLWGMVDERGRIHTIVCADALRGRRRWLNGRWLSGRRRLSWPDLSCRELFASEIDVCVLCEANDEQN